MIANFAASRRQFAWPHPEWWTVGLSAAAWAAMLRHAWQHAGHESAHRLPFATELQYWLLMVVAMMFPFVLDTVRHTAEFSLWRRRHRAIAGFLIGYMAPWLVLGGIAAALRQSAWAHSHLTAALAFAAATLWLRSPIHLRAEVACHRRLPLAPDGWQADRDCLRFGSAIGSSCVLSCWALMLGCAMAGHGMVAMAGGLAVTVQQRWYFRPRRRAALWIALGLSAFYGVRAILDLAS